MRPSLPPPHGAGSWIVQFGESPKDADPFDDDGVTLESTYGTTPQLWTYDNGCTGQFVAGAGTAIGNILLQISGAIPNWTHALLAAVVHPDSPVQALDNPVVDSTRAVTEGVWRPWITVAVLLVLATAIWRARTGHVAGSATAVAWAGVVILGTSLLISYPAESVLLVDDGVRNAVTLIATGFEDHRSPGEDPAVAAINGQMDEVVRSTQYRTWLTGAPGDADCATAREYGPDLSGRPTALAFRDEETLMTARVGAVGRSQSATESGSQTALARSRPQWKASSRVALQAVPISLPLMDGALVRSSTACSRLSPPTVSTRSATVELAAFSSTLTLRRFCAALDLVSRRVGQPAGQAPANRQLATPYRILGTTSSPRHSGTDRGGSLRACFRGDSSRSRWTRSEPKARSW